VGGITIATVALVAAGCGDDDDEAGGTAEYCELSRELDEQEEFPSAEQLEALRDAAPEEIREDVDFVADRFIEAIEAGNPSSAFEDPEVEERFGPIEEFEEAECGLAGDEEDEEGAEQDPSVTELDPDAARVDVTATEYAFEFDGPAAGRTSFVMTNEGEESHFMLIAKLAEGATFEEALEAEDPEAEGLLDESFPEAESDVAGPDEEAVLTVDLTPGTYGMLCFLPSPDGTAHAELGMIEEFTVS
jgi:uncharacterized cupredoxin-like copper-binding protein